MRSLSLRTGHQRQRQRPQRTRQAAQAQPHGAAVRAGVDHPAQLGVAQRAAEGGLPIRLLDAHDLLVHSLVHPDTSRSLTRLRMPSRRTAAKRRRHAAGVISLTRPAEPACDRVPFRPTTEGSLPTMTTRRISYKILGFILLLLCLPLDINTSLGLTIAMTLALVGLILIFST